MRSICIFFTILTYSLNLSAIPFEGKKVVMSGPNPNAILVATEVAKKGGNVADTIVAMGLALAVTSPYFASFGGGGFALIKMDKEKKPRALDFREMAPEATHPKFYLDKGKTASTIGGNAIGVPGILAGLWKIHKTYGKLPWKTVIAGAIDLAENGFQVSGDWWGRTKRSMKKFSPETAQHIFKKKGTPYEPGDILKQKGLAKALKLIRKDGPKALYGGLIGKDIASTVQKNGGVMTVADLKNYKTRWLKPIETQFAGHDIYIMPPPSSGGVVIATGLKLIEQLKLKQYPPQSANELHVLAEIMSRSFRGRGHLADPDYYKNPLDLLLSKKYIKELKDSISKTKKTKISALNDKQFNDSSETTHFAVMDKDGNAISMTVTLNGNYGSGVFSDKYGISLNNEMDDFTTRPGEPNMFGLIQGQGNKVEAGKRPLSSMSPTIAMKNGKVVMALGSPGGPRIISSVMQVLYRVLVNGMNMDQAIQFPRIHHQFLPDKVLHDPFVFSPDTIALLKKRGHKMEVPSWHAKVYGVRKNKNGYLEAAFDARGEGGVGGF